MGTSPLDFGTFHGITPSRALQILGFETIPLCPFFPPPNFYFTFHASRTLCSPIATKGL